MINENEVLKMSIEELVEYIKIKYHEPLRIFLEEIVPKINYILENYSKKYPKIENLEVLFFQFKTELLKHMNKEDLIVFPAIIKYEKEISNENIDNICEIQKLVGDIKMKNDHSEFMLYFNSIIELLKVSDLNGLNIKEFKEIKEKFIFLEKETQDHSALENDFIYLKGMELQEKLKEKLVLVS